MEEPDFDDLINDYVDEDYDEVAQFQQEAERFYFDGAERMDEDLGSPTVMEDPGQTVGITTNRAQESQAGAANHDSSFTSNSNPGLLSHPDADHQNHVIPNAREFISRSNTDNLYQFKRYQHKQKWRGDPLSTTQQKNPTSWKVLFRSTSKQGLQYRQPTAPDAQLIHCLQRQRNADNQFTLKLAVQVPQQGRDTLPITLCDSRRVHLYTNRKSQANQLNCTLTAPTSTDYVLGLSMSQLKRKSEQIRRKKFQKSVTGAPGPTSTSSTINRGKLWVVKHAPSTFSHLLSDERTNREVLRAIRAWDPYVFGRAAPPRPTFANSTANEGTNSRQNSKAWDKRPDEHNRVILLSGPPGVGKTTMAHVIARKAGYRPFEVNASDERSATVLIDRVLRATEPSTIRLPSNSAVPDAGKPNCIILDEVDGADVRGAIQSLVELIRSEIPEKKGARTKATYLRRPIIFICNHKYSTALRPLLPFARHFHVDPPSPTRLVTRLKAVLASEKLNKLTGSSLLHQLAISSGGDIRACLFSLQFAAVQARDGKDLSHALSNSLNGTGLKDGRSDVASTVTDVFRRVTASEVVPGRSGRKGDREDILRIMHAVDAMGENSATINILFLNLPNVSYIDPTFDRCSAAHEWLSESDLFLSEGLASNDQTASYSLQRYHLPSAAAAIHLLCRVELKPILTFSTRDLSAIHYGMQENHSLLKKFVDGIPIHSRKVGGVKTLVTEFIPLLLSILLADPSLSRAASSVDVLTKRERIAVEYHVVTLQSLGLKYVDDDKIDESSNPKLEPNDGSLRLEPPVETLAVFQNLNPQSLDYRKVLPLAMKRVICQQIALGNVREGERNKLPENQNPESSNSGKDLTLPNVEHFRLTHPKKEPSNTTSGYGAQNDASNSPVGLQMQGFPRASAAPDTNFLGHGAKRAREARAARKAAAVGLETTKKIKITHTGSGIPMPQAIRLRFVKGFTNAIRTPCQAEDLIH